MVDAVGEIGRCVSDPFLFVMSSTPIRLKSTNQLNHIRQHIVANHTGLLTTNHILL